MTGEYLTSLTPEHKKFLEELFKDGVSFDPKVLRVYASDASLLTGTVLAMVRPKTPPSCANSCAGPKSSTWPFTRAGAAQAFRAGACPRFPA